jgi:hypothetical protein
MTIVANKRFSEISAAKLSSPVGCNGIQPQLVGSGVQLVLVAGVTNAA